MPPKGWRKTAAGFQPTNSSGVNIKDRKTHGLDELLLPRTLIARMAKQSLPENTPLPRDGVTALMRGAAMFTSYITSEANLIANNESRKTVTHTDILRALESCHFGSFVNATSELSEQVVVAPKPAKANKEEGELSMTADADQSTQNVTSATAQGEDDEDDYHIEEDVEPSIEFDSIHFPLVFNDLKRVRFSKNGSAREEDMQVDS